MALKKIFLTFSFLLIVFDVNCQVKINANSFQKELFFKVNYFQMPLLSNIKEVTKKIEKDTFQVHIGSAYWASFNLSVNKKTKYIKFTLPTSDKIILYTPKLYNKYKADTIGLLNNLKKIHTFSQTTTLLIHTDSVDFYNPFYIKNIPSSIFGLNAVHTKKIAITLYKEKPITLVNLHTKNSLNQSNFNYLFNLLIGMIILAFLIIFVHYLITKRIYFLWYSLYLFFLIFNYTYRTFYFYNIYFEWHNHLYLYINQNGQMLANLAYLLFIRDFVNVKKNYPNLYSIYQIKIYFFIAFAIIYNITIIINPFFPYHLKIFNVFVYTVSLISLVFITYMFIYKMLAYTSLVFAGSLLLLIGYVSAKVFSNFFILVPLIVIETLLFIGIITYLDLKYFKKSLKLDKLEEINILKNKFYTNISHEFRTPLMLISGPIQKRLFNPNIKESDKKEFSLIKKNTERLLNLVNQMLDLSKLDSGFMKLSITQSNLTYYLQQLISNFNYQATEKQITILTKINNIPNAWFDRGSIEKIVFNLLSNAIKYSPKNSTINIEATQKQQHLHFIISNKIKNNKLLNEIDKIFNRFYQLNNFSEGTGIGLSLVKELVEFNNGTISHYIEKDNILVFYIIIPINERSNNKTTNNSLQTINKKIQTQKLPTILLVDDNKELLSFMSSILSKKYIILQATDGEKGIQKALKYIPNLIVSDIMMPIIDGVELCNSLKKNKLTSHIPIILLTAKYDAESKIKGLYTGADAYISKPFDLEIFQIRIQKLIEVRENIKKHYVGILDTDTKLVNKNIETEFIENLKNVIDEHILDSNFKSETLASIMGVNRMQLHRKLRALTGMTTSEFIRLQRLQFATLLLKENKWTVAEIAFKSGFKSPSYFTKVFKKTYHCLPKDF